MSKKTIWTKDFILLCTVNFLVVVSSFLLMVTVAQYALDEIKTSASVAGFIASSYIIGTFFGRFFSNKLISTWSIRRVMIIGIILFIITTTLHIFIESTVLLIIVRIIQGFGFGLTNTISSTLIAQALPEEKISEGIFYFSLTNVIGTGLGPFIGIILKNFGSEYFSIFLFSAIVSIMILPFFKLVSINVFSIENTYSNEDGFKVQNFIEIKVVFICLIVLLASFAYSSILTFLVAYTSSINLVQAGGMFFAFYATSIICTRPFIGKYMDRIGANKIIIATLLFYAIGMYLFSIAVTAKILLLSAVLIGIGFGNFQSAAQAYALKQVNVSQFNKVNSTYYIFFDISMALGPLIMGLIITKIDYREYYFLMVLVILLGMLLYLFKVFYSRNKILRLSKTKV